MLSVFMYLQFVCYRAVKSLKMVKIEWNYLFQLNIEPNHTTLAGHGYEHDVVMASA